MPPHGGYAWARRVQQLPPAVVRGCHLTPGACVICGDKAARGSNRCVRHGGDVPTNRRSGSQSVWKLVLGAIGLGLLLLAIVGGLIEALAPSRTPITLEKYADTFCSGSGLSHPTWGQMREFARTRLKELRRVEPPDEVRQYHEATIEGLELMLKAIRYKPSDDPLNEWELLGNPDAMRAVQAAEQADRGLDFDTRVLLMQHGCAV